MFLQKKSVKTMAMKKEIDKGGKKLLSVYRNKEENSLDRWIHRGAIWFKHKVVYIISWDTNFVEIL